MNLGETGCENQMRMEQSHHINLHVLVSVVLNFWVLLKAALVINDIDYAMSIEKRQHEYESQVYRDVEITGHSLL
jgi:hypothetical protein